MLEGANARRREGAKARMQGCTNAGMQECTSEDRNAAHSEKPKGQKARRHEGRKAHMTGAFLPCCLCAFCLCALQSSVQAFAGIFSTCPGLILSGSDS